MISPEGTPTKKRHSGARQVNTEVYWVAAALSRITGRKTAGRVSARSEFGAKREIENPVGSSTYAPTLISTMSRPRVIVIGGTVEWSTKM